MVVGCYSLLSDLGGARFQVCKAYRPKDRSLDTPSVPAPMEQIEDKELMSRSCVLETSHACLKMQVHPQCHGCNRDYIKDLI